MRQNGKRVPSDDLLQIALISSRLADVWPAVAIGVLEGCIRAVYQKYKSKAL